MKDSNVKRTCFSSYVNYNCKYKKNKLTRTSIKTKKYITYMSQDVKVTEREREREREGGGARERRLFTDGSIMMLTICRYTNKKT